MVTEIPIILLARMGSARFPGKHLAQLGGRPMIAGIIERMRPLSRVVVATCNGPKQDALIAVAEDAGADVFIGPEHDIWTRVDDCLDAIGAKQWVMYSADCPFVDPRLVTLVMADMLTSDDDYYVPQPTRNRMEGVMVQGWRRRFWKRIGEDLPSELRECPWQRTSEVEHSERYVEHNVFDETHTNIKFSIDYPLELAVANRIIEHIGHWPMSYDEIIAAYKTIRSLS